MDYSTLPDLDGVYLEDSFVLDVIEDEQFLTSRLDGALTPAHPHYHQPKAGEQHCYEPETLSFDQIKNIEWIQRNDIKHKDATGEEDRGNIDFDRQWPRLQ